MFVKFDIPRRSRRCVAGDELFSPGASYYSLLEEEKKGFSRKDFCEACFKPTKGPFWKSKIPEKPPQDACLRALELFYEVQENTQVAFVLALYLARKKIFAARHETDEAIIYEVLETEEMIPVHKVQLSELDIDSLQEEIAKRLK